jgi:perosamine synthetase
MMNVPFFRVDLTDEEITEVVATLRSGWLTSGPRVQKFEAEFGAAVGAKHAVAVNSCTAALHLALEALGVQPGDAVLVPTLTFAATAEVVRYLGAVPILVDCEPRTLNMDLADAERKLAHYAHGTPRSPMTTHGRVVGIIAVHVGGRMMSPAALAAFANRHGIWLVEDAAHAFPAAWRSDEKAPRRRCGDDTAAVTCFSFYANKTITTGEGGMAVTSNAILAERMKLMSLHGLSHDAWHRYNGGKSWDYSIMAPGFKYNLTDIAAALGCVQLQKAENMRTRREEIAHRYFKELGGVGEIELPEIPCDCLHAWHLFPIRLHLPRLTVDRAKVIDLLRERGVGSSVHWRPLHLHPYYEQTFGWRSEDFPVASSEWERLTSLPLYPSMSDAEIAHVVLVVKNLCRSYARQV